MFVRRITAAVLTVTAVVTLLGTPAGAESMICRRLNISSDRSATRMQNAATFDEWETAYIFWTMTEAQLADAGC